MENNALKSKSSQLCIDIMDLSALQLIFTDKKKLLIDELDYSFESDVAAAHLLFSRVVINAH